MTNQIYTDKTEYLKYFNFINGAIQTESWNKIYKIKNNLNMYSSNPTAFTDLYVEGAGINYWNCSQKGVGGGCGPVRPDTAHNHQIDYFCRVHMIRRHLIYKRNKKLTSFSISTALCFTWPETKYFGCSRSHSVLCLGQFIRSLMGKLVGMPWTSQGRCETSVYVVAGNLFVYYLVQ